MYMWMAKQMKRNKKGFTLIELIVVIAILAILALIAIPRLAGLQDRSRINADKSTAMEIIKAARTMEVERNDGAATLDADAAGTNWDATFMAEPAPQSGGDFTLSGGLNTPYAVTWTPTRGSILAAQTVTEP